MESGENPWCHLWWPWFACSHRAEAFVKMHCRSAGLFGLHWLLVVLVMMTMSHRLLVVLVVLDVAALMMGLSLSRCPFCWCAQTVPCRCPCPRHNLGAQHQCDFEIACRRERPSHRHLWRRPKPKTSPWAVVIPILWCSPWRTTSEMNWGGCSW